MEEAIIHLAQGKYVTKTCGARETSCLRVDIEAICYPAMCAALVSELAANGWKFTKQRN
jgi:hypothetical protein